LIARFSTTLRNKIVSLPRRNVEGDCRLSLVVGKVFAVDPRHQRQPADCRGMGGHVDGGFSLKERSPLAK